MLILSIPRVQLTEAIIAILKRQSMSELITDWSKQKVSIKVVLIIWLLVVVVRFRGWWDCYDGTCRVGQVILSHICVPSGRSSGVRRSHGMHLQ